MDHSPPKVVKKRIRKPRGRGLRTNTGCLTCRTRHKKCDEKKPRCGPCTNSDRDCVYAGAAAAPRDAADAATAATTATTTTATSPGTATPASNSSRIQNILCSPHSAPPGPVAPTLDYDATSGPSLETHNILDPELVALYPNTRPQPTIPEIYDGPLRSISVQSPETLTPDVNNDNATTKWLNLLATDAAQAGNGFSLPSASSSASQSRLSRGSVSQLQDLTSAPTQQYFPPQIAERHAWQADSDIALSHHEAALLRNFADRIALPLDLFDSHKHFSNYATRLALRNVGLMKAILALSARYSSLSSPNDPSSSSNSTVDPNESIQFYYETLHYVSTALQYNSYKHSEELLATAIVVSTYEMLDASEHNSNWQRHLKGVFWIQRSQDVNGASGGLRQAVWWAWLRQDLWAAFREHRRCFSFWQPIVDYPDLSHEDLAYRSVYLLSQVVNYCTEPPSESGQDVDPEQVRLRTERGNELMDMLERWRSFASAAFKAFPGESRDEGHGWTPIWVHPPSFGVALQVYSFAKILVSLHRPVATGFAGYRQFQKTLTDAVATICGIAIELNDPSCQIISAQCLFGAGLCVQDTAQQETIISLIQACEARTGWPMATMQDDLRKEWAKVTGEGAGQGS
ncbi:Zn(II)2Cys6 transcription factor [Aspergillus undulatus]|uniref:Zn(II)2Cys6 transcription factor n=1 Tax=Aspergillus undulatus TaxID=1810928 RepID=UPI003CCDC9C0